MVDLIRANGMDLRDIIDKIRELEVLRDIQHGEEMDVPL